MQQKWIAAGKPSMQQDTRVAELDHFDSEYSTWNACFLFFG
jgi:hypothetical protein